MLGLPARRSPIAIGFDVFKDLTTTWAAGSTTPAAFTVGAGSNRALYVFVFYQAAVIGSIVSTSVTYNGVALSNVSQVTDGVHLTTEVWCLVNPPSGAHNVVVNYSGAPALIGWGGIAFSGESLNSPWNTRNSAGQSTPITNATFPTFSVPVQGGSYGFACGSVFYVNPGDGPSNTPSVFTTLTAGGNLANSAGVSVPSNTYFCCHGAYDGTSQTCTLSSNDGGGYTFNMAMVSLQSEPTPAVFPDTRFGCSDDLWLTETVE